MSGISPLEIIAILVGGLVLGVAGFILCLGFFFFLGPSESLVKQRLIALQENSPSQGVAHQDGLSLLKQQCLAWGERVSKSLYGQNRSYLEGIRVLLQQAGLSDHDEILWRFLALRVMNAFILGAICLFLSLFLHQPPLFQAAALIIGLLLGTRVMELRLRMQAKRRKLEIRFTLPDTLDLMVVCVEAGLGLDATIQRVGDEVEDLAPELSSELKRVTRELLAGIPRIEAFHNLGIRTGVEELKSLCALMIQTDKLGTSIADTLRIYSDDVRTRRRLRAEELASKASIKMTFPLVLFIFPPLFIVLMGPVVIQMMHSFLK